MVARIDVDIRRRGPFFDRRARRAVEEFATEAVTDAAEYTVARWLATIGPRLSLAATGYYESQIRWSRLGRLHAVAWDGRIVYGPWLEGTGSRNHPVTRFRGYHSAEDATREVNRTLEPRLDRLWQARYAPRVN